MAHARERKPDWIRVQGSSSKSYQEFSQLLHKGNLHTVCESAMCPNIHECWGTHKTATFMILGDVCTRHCRFCVVKTGLPAAPDTDEPRRLPELTARVDRHPCSAQGIWAPRFFDKLKMTLI
jgi:lipoic acid synthetase